VAWEGLNSHMGQDQELPMIRWRPRAQVAASQPIYCSRPRRRQAGRYPVFRLAPGVKSGMNEAGQGSPMDLPRVRVRLIGAGTLRVGPADARPSLPGTAALVGRSLRYVAERGWTVARLAGLGLSGVEVPPTIPGLDGHRRCHGHVWD
jgi:hypothetical protein